MGIIHAAIGTDDSDNRFLNEVGQSIVYSASQQIVDRYNAEMTGAISVFVAGMTTEHKTRYKLPATGRMARRGGLAQSPAHKATGQWDVAFPIDDYGDALAWDDVTFAKMTLQEYDRHLSGILIRDANTVRYQVLRRLFDNVATTHEDPDKGTLTIQPLANGDAVKYPPLIGADAEATDNHYLVSGYAPADISDTNNPFVTIRAELEEHFGKETGGSMILCLINPAQTAKVEVLASFKEVGDAALSYGDGVTLPINLPSVPGSARVIGRCEGVWVAEWDYIPAAYIAGVHTQAEKPLLMRHDLPATGLGPGLQLVARDMDYPMETLFYRHRYGLGVGNRLNGVVMQVKASGDYDIPAAYTAVN